MSTIRSHRFLADAIRDIGMVQEHARTLPDDTRDTLINRYGSLCHQVPILLLTSGLRPTLAFLDAKSRGDTAHRLIRDHLMGILDPASNATRVSGSAFLQATVTGVSDQMIAVHTLLDALVYYKRLAESELGVDAANAERVEETAA